MRESTIEKYLVAQVEAHGGEVRKLKWINRNSAPDRVVMLPAQRATQTIDCAYCNPKGLSIWVELKAPGKEPTPAQKREHERMRRVGQTVLVIDSLEGVDALIARRF